MVATFASATGGTDSQAGGSEVTTLTTFVNHSWYPITGFTGAIADQITEDTGIRLDITIAVDSRQLGVMIASGDLPDLTYTDSQLDTLSNAGISHSYDDLIKQYGIDWDIDPMLRGNSLLFSTDGKIYFVRNHAPTTSDWQDATSGVPMTGSLGIRQDILDELGNPRLETLEDLEKIYEMVKEAYPEMILLEFNPWWQFNVFRIWSGVTMLNWLEQSDGSYNYYANTAVYKDMLEMLNRWYRKGFMIADNFALQDQAPPWYAAGQAFSASFCTQNCNYEDDFELQALNPNYKSVEVAPLDHADYATSDIGWSGTFISKDTAHPKAAIEYMAYMFTPYAQRLTQMGREGIDYELDPTSGLPVFAKEWTAALAEGTHNTKYNPWLYFGGSELVEAIARTAAIPDYAENYAQVYDEIRAGYRNAPWISAAEPQGQTDERIALTKIKDMVVPFEAKIIMAATDAEFEANYAEFVSSMKGAGLDMLEDYMSQRIPQMQQKY
jgi:putative aldouronate transport system substrate-binding protein